MAIYGFYECQNHDKELAGCKGTASGILIGKLRDTER